MINVRQVLVALALTHLMGCYVVVADSHHHSHDSQSSIVSHGYDLWVESTHVGCVDMGGQSEWTMEASVGGVGYWYYYDYTEVDVTVYIDGWDWYWTAYDGDNYWIRIFISSYYRCDEVHDFFFVAQAVDGSEATALVQW